MSKRKYALDILEETGMLGSKPCFTPLMSNTKFLFETTDKLQNLNPYRRLIGKFLYLTNIRPNITFVVELFSQFVQEPTVHHQQVVQDILRYIKANLAHGLFFNSESEVHIKAFNYSDWASCPNTRHSTTDYFLFRGYYLISWKTKKQHIVSRSSSEAEYKALMAIARELQLINYILRDLHVQTPDLATLYYDNQSTHHITHNPSFHERMKHIDIDLPCDS